MTSSDQQEDDNPDAFSPADDQLIIRLESRDYSSVWAEKSAIEKEEPALGPGKVLKLLHSDLKKQKNDLICKKQKKQNQPINKQTVTLSNKKKVYR